MIFVGNLIAIYRKHFSGVTENENDIMLSVLQEECITMELSMLGFHRSLSTQRHQLKKEFNNFYFKFVDPEDSVQTQNLNPLEAGVIKPKH